MFSKNVSFEECSQLILGNYSEEYEKVCCKMQYIFIEYNIVGLNEIKEQYVKNVIMYVALSTMTAQIHSASKFDYNIYFEIFYSWINNDKEIICQIKNDINDEKIRIEKKSGGYN